VPPEAVSEPSGRLTAATPASEPDDAALHYEMAEINMGKE
jgi:hypothetical protein